MRKQIPNSAFILLLIFGFFMTACKSALVPGYEYNISKIGIDISKHNTEYQLTSDTIFLGSTQKKIDEFDANLFNSLNKRLLERGFTMNQSGELQTYQLSDCLIEFNKQKPELTINGLDSIYKSSLLTTIVCKEVTDTTKLFFSSYKTFFNYDFQPIKTFSTATNQSINWQFSKSYAYLEKPFNSTQIEENSKNLATNIFQKIDTTNILNFKKNYPDIYSSKYKKSTYTKGSGLFLAMVLLLIVVLIP
jgi:hypothetical protein